VRGVRGGRLRTGGQVGHSRIAAAAAARRGRACPAADPGGGGGQRALRHVPRRDVRQGPEPRDSSGPAASPLPRPAAADAATILTATAAAAASAVVPAALATAAAARRGADLAGGVGSASRAGRATPRRRAPRSASRCWSQIWRSNAARLPLDAGLSVTMICLVLPERNVFIATEGAERWRSEWRY
jgi:hypothetical protein